MQLNALAQLVVNLLDHIHAALVVKSRGQQGLEGLLLLIGRLWDGSIENGLDKSVVALLDVLGVEQGVVDIGGAVVKSREQEAQLRCGDHLSHGAVVEQFFLSNIVQVGLCLLHGADGADHEGIAFLTLVLLERIVLALEGHVIGLAAQEDQVIVLEGDGVDDLLVEAPPQLVILQLAVSQVHQQLMLRGACHLGRLKGDVDQILAQTAGQGPLQEGKVLFSFVLRHDAQGLAELGDNLLLAIDVAAIDIRHITAVPAQVPPDLADFLIIHCCNLAKYKNSS